MQVRGTDWVALSNGRGQIARSPTFHISQIWRHRIHHGYHSSVAPCATLGLRVASLGFWVMSLGLRVAPVGFRVVAFGFRMMVKCAG